MSFDAVVWRGCAAVGSGVVVIDGICAAIWVYGAGVWRKCAAIQEFGALVQQVYVLF